jgi:DNA-binding CsgD family transcriptional regulator/DNA-binding transcriptional ArsR family regulator
LVSEFFAVNAYFYAVSKEKVQKQLEIESKVLRQGLAVYRAILHAERLRILTVLHKSKSLNVSGLAHVLKIKQPVLSMHLRQLRETKWLIATKRRQQVFYSINYPEINRITLLSSNLAPFSRRVEENVELIPPKLLEQMPHLQKDSFTERELSIIKLICDQKQPTEIARKFRVSPKEIEQQVNIIFKKMEVKNTAGLVVYSIKNKLYRI